MRKECAEIDRPERFTPGAWAVRFFDTSQPPQPAYQVGVEGEVTFDAAF